MSTAKAPAAPSGRICEKLKCIGITGPLFNLFSDYLNNRKQRVGLNGSCSSWQNI